MFAKKRRFHRKTAHFPVTLVLYNIQDDSTLTGPVSSFLLDISYEGAGLLLPKIYFTPYHLFYAPLENSEIRLCLEKKHTEDQPPLIIPVRPVWFRLGDKETKGYFRLGVEFQTDPEDSDVIALEEMVLSGIESQESLLDKLRRIFH